MTKVLVSGAAGFIGSHVVRHLLKKDCHVTVVDDLSGGFKENLVVDCEYDRNLVFLKVDLSDTNQYALVEAAFKKMRYDYVYHLAAYAAEGLSHFIRRFNYNNNLIASANLINSCVRHKVKCFVFTSSIATYGTPDKLPVTDRTPLKPEDPYGIAKLAVEMDLKAAHKMFGLNYVIFRPHNVYGERQNIGDKYRNVLGIFMNQILKGEPLTIFGDGNQTRAFSYIDDVAPHIADAPFMDKDERDAIYQQAINVGADTPYTINELATKVCEAFGVEKNVKHLPARNEVKDIHADHTLMKYVFGCKPTVDLDVGIRKMAGWVKKHGARESSKFKNIEIEENLPSSWK